MRIAYLILAHSNPHVLNKLIKRLTADRNVCFLHVDKKASFGMSEIENHSRLVWVEPRLSINWGGFSIVEATLELIKEAAMYGHFDRFVLLSGDSYPVKSNLFINKFFVRNRNFEFINTVKMPGIGKNLDRFKFYLEYDVRAFNLYTLLAKVINFISLTFFTRADLETQLNLTPYGGSQWWALSEKAIAYCLGYLKNNPNYIALFRRVFIPDESFFQTILCNSSFRRKIKNAVMYTDWTGNNAPNEILSSHLKVLNKKVSGPYGDFIPLFARKFSDKSLTLIKRLDA